MDNFMFVLERPPTFPPDTESLLIPKYIPEDRFSMTVDDQAISDTTWLTLEELQSLRSQILIKKWSFVNPQLNL